MADRVATLRVRPLAPRDLDEVIRIDAAHTSASKPEYWREVFARYLRTRTHAASFGLAIDADGPAIPPAGGSRRRGGLRSATSTALAAYLFGEVRAFEFGAEPAGWIFAVGVDPAHARKGMARTLLGEAKARFTALGVGRVRTMVRRDDVPILAFFRTAGFVGGPFVQLELQLAVHA